MATTGKTFRIFVSSTFGDLKEERNALQEKVFPRLRELCRQNGCRFQAVDLRWGVREEAGLDQQTMKICLGEIERCQKITPRPNFIVLLGDRYGWRPLPPEIPADEFEKIEKAIDNTDEAQWLQKWYRRDDNAVPPVYCLQPRKIEVEGNAGDEERRRVRDEEAARWKEIEGRLRRILGAAVAQLNFPPPQTIKYLASATEQEIEAGAMRVADAEKHVVCFFRHIEGLPADREAAVFVDLDEKGAIDGEAAGRLASLKERLRSRLKDNVHEYQAAWNRGTASTDHLEALCEDAWRALSGIITSEISQMREVDALEREVADHDIFGQSRARFFAGREAYLRGIASYLEGPTRSPLALFGASGSGKSALLAKAIEQARRNHGKAEFAVRFIGATPSSGDVRSLLEGLCRQVTRAYGGDESTIPAEYNELKDEFPKRLALSTAEKPLIVILDALDQLSESHNAHNLIWLPTELPENVRLVVSTAPAECWEPLKKRVVPAGQLDLQPMTAEEGGEVLEAWLKDSGRTLQAHQRREVLAKFSSNGLPLYLKFAFEEARRWPSGGPPVDLKPELTGIIRQLFSRLSSESNHGKILVERSLAYLRAAKSGLSEDEIIDVLSRDVEVFDDFQKRSFFTPPEPRLPVVVWSRFYFDMEPYLNERTADGATLLGFFHRQLGEVVDEDYLVETDRTMIHANLAAYFVDQPLFNVRGDQKTPNLRKLAELPFQQTYGALWDDVHRTLTDFDFLEAKCTYSGIIHSPEGKEGSKVYGGVYELIEDYRRALAVFPVDK